MSAAGLRRRARDRRQRARRRARLGRTLVDERLAACVNVVGPIRSIYRWQGAVEEADEHLRAAEGARRRRRRARGARPRAPLATTCPRCWRCPCRGGSAPYLAWLAEATARDG